MACRAFLLLGSNGVAQVFAQFTLMSLYPTFLRLSERRVLLVGAGKVAATKLRSLIDVGASVVVVAPEVSAEIAAEPVEIHRRAFSADDLDDVWFVVAAAPAAVNRQVSQAAHARHIFVNAVDDVENASAYAGAVVRRAGVTIALSTDGEAPALAGLLREALETVLPDDLDRWMDCARDARRRWLADGVPMEQRRPLLLEALIDLYAERAHAAPQGGAR
jgi:siroheme synthase-like protein